MITAYRVPCQIQATNNDHLMIAELKLSSKYACLLVTGIRAMLQAKLHKLIFADVARELPIVVSENEQLQLEFGGHINAEISTEQLETLEDFVIDWILQRVKPNTRCNLRLSGTNELMVDFALKIAED